MSHLHRKEREQFHKLLTTVKPGADPGLLQVLDAFLASEEHLTVAELHAVAAKDHPEITPAKVAEALEIFRRFGFAYKKSFEGQPDRYEHRHPDSHHDHLICLNCGSITELADPDLERRKVEAVKRLGFRPITHHLEVYGLCRECALRRAPTMPLVLARSGERVRFVRAEGGREMAGRLSDLGLCFDSEVEVLTNDGGPLVIACGGTRLALGQGMGRKIMVTPVTNGDQEHKEPDEPVGERDGQ